MDENLHDIDDLFKKAINEHEELPSESVWGNIDRNLDKKKVVFISKKYNKLKWIAAALLMFSAGMAMYTWHTKLTNKELVKQTSATGEKRISRYKPPNGNNKEIDTNIALTAKAENNAPVKDTAGKAGQNETAKSPDTQNTDVLLKQNKNNIETAEARREAAGKKDSVNIAKTFSENKEQTVKRLAEVKENDLGKATDSEINQKGIKMMRYDKNQNVAFNTGYEASLKTRKEVDAKTEIRRSNFNIQPVNSSLQNSLEMLSQKQNLMKVKESMVFSSVKISKKAFKKSLFSATVFYSPDFVSKKIDNDHHRFVEDDRDQIKNKEEVKTSYSAGVLINYDAWRKFSIESGIIFSALSTYIQPQLIYARPDDMGNINYRFNCSAGYSYIPPHQPTTLANGDSTTASASKNILNYISVPLTLKYRLVAGKFSVNPGFGAAFNFLTKGKIETAIKGASGDEKLNLSHIEGLNSMYLSSALSVGLNYGISKNIAFSFTPAARFALSSINKNTPVKTFINSYGLAAGLTIKL